MTMSLPGRIGPPGVRFLLLLTMAMATAGPAHAVEDTRILRVGIYDNAPKVFLDERDRAAGFWPDLTRVIAERRGWRIEWVHGTWAEGLQRLRDNRIDVMVDVATTPRRRERYAFGEELAHISWSRIYRHPDTNIETLADLAGRRIGGLAESVNLSGPDGLYDLLDDLGIEAEVVTLPSYRAVLQALESGRVDAAVTNRDFGNRNEGAYAIERTPIVFQPAEIRYAFTRDAPATPALIAAFDRELSALKTDPGSAYHQLVDRWLGPSTGPDQSLIDLAPRAQWVLVVLAAVAVIAAVLVAVLNHRLRRNRRELQRYSALLDRTQHLTATGSWYLSLHTGVLEWSEQMYRLCGVSPESFDPTPEAFLDLVHPADHAKLADLRELSLSAGDRHAREYRIVRPDGTERVVHERVATETDARGRIQALSGSLQDVTERREAELRNELYRRLIEASNEKFCALDAHGRYVLITRGYRKAYGFGPELKEGSHLRDAFDDAFLDREVWPALRNALEGREQRIDAERTSPDGELRHVQLHYFPVYARDGHVELVGLSVNDVTAFQRTLNALQEQTRLIDIAGRLARLGGFRVDLDNQRVIWSDVVAELHGKPPGYTPSVDEGLAFIDDAHRERLEAAFHACATEGRPYDEALVIVAADGRRFWARAVGQPVRDESGRIVAVEGAFQDIDTDKQREERLNQYRNLVEGSAELFKVTDASYRYVLVNKAYAAWAGHTPASILGRAVRDVLGEEHFEASVRPHLDRALAGETVTSETVRKRHDGVERTLLVRYFPIASPVDGGRQVATIATDITESRQAERELQRQLELSDIAGRMANVGGWTADASGQNVEWSDTTARIHARPPGYSPTLAGALDYYTEESRPRIEAHVQACLTEGTSYSDELEIVDAEGCKRWVRTMGEATHDEAGRISGAHGAIQDITDIKRLQDEREHLHARMAHMLESITDAFLTVDRDWNFRYVNAEAARIMGTTPESMVGCNAWTLFPDATGTVFEQTFREAMEQQTSAAIEEYYPPLGMWLDIRVYPVDDGLALYFRDVSERHRMVEQLREQEQRLREHRDELATLLETRQSLINALPAHVALLDHEGVLLDVNEHWRRHGRNEGSPGPACEVGASYLEACDAGAQSAGARAPDIAHAIRRVLAGEEPERVIEFAITDAPEERWFRATVTRIAAPLPGEPSAVVMYLDITERKIAERELRKLAYEDPLTGLASRNGISWTIDDHIERNGWSPRAIVVMLDLDRQRDINEVHGFDAGDQLLRDVGQRLVERLPGDAVVARAGGDEFALFIPDASAGDDEPDRAIEAAFDAPFVLDDVRVTVEARFGYVVLGDEPRSADTLLREAELSLFHTREAHDRRWTVYTPELRDQNRDRIETTRELRRALANDELCLHFQPKVELDSGRMVSAEALLRWEHPTRGLVPPGQFVPVAEQSRLIGPIGDWALRSACRMLHEWGERGLDIVRISVNISVVQLAAGDFAATVADALDAYAVDPGSLTLEITESVFERESEHLREQIARLRELGVYVSLDDFGTGYSSLLYLHRYPFDEIKIDQNFVRHMLSDEYSPRIVDTVIGLAEALGSQLVAEGVETAAIAEALMAKGCRIGQGYHYSMPLADEDFVWLLESQSSLPVATA